MRLALLAAAAAALVAVAAASAMVTRHATTKTYSLTLNVGPMEPMYTPAQVKAKHPKSGEVMLGGDMMSVMGKGSVRHLELHIRSRRTGAVVQVMPIIELTDLSVKHAMTAALPVVKMRGLWMGMGDIHYGNNVALHVGHTYRVTTGVKSESARFSFKAS